VEVEAALHAAAMEPCDNAPSKRRPILLKKLLSSSPISANFSIDEETALTERRHHTIVL
jgi:hypothetical protein